MRLMGGITLTGQTEFERVGTEVSEADYLSTSYRHAILEAMGVLNGHWRVAVLASLASGPLTYTDLFGEINKAEEQLNWISHPQPISHKVLSATLKRMRRDGLIIRIPPETRFREVYYRLAPLGRSLLQELRSLAKWAMKNADVVERARAQFDESPDEV